MNLYEINRELEEIICLANEQAEESDGEISEGIGAELEGLEMAREDKVDNLCCVIKNLNAQAKAIREEEKNLASRRKVVENRATRAKEWLLMNVAEGEKVETPRSRVSWRKSTSVEYNGEAETLPEALKKVAVTADKTEIKNALKAGQEIDGARLVEKKNINIK